MPAEKERREVHICFFFTLIYNIPYFMLPERGEREEKFSHDVFILYFVAADGTLDDGWGRWE